MADAATTLGGPDGRFPSTSWAALGQEEDLVGRQQLLERLARVYWKPVYCLIRRSWSRSNEDAKDLTQEFFTEILLEGRLLERFRPERGRFRAYLKAALSNFMSKQARDAARLKRGGDVRVVSFAADTLDLERLLPDAQTLTPEEVFDRSWKRAVFDRALDMLEARLRSEGKELCHQVFRRYEFARDATYASVAEALGISPDAVKNCLTAAREAFLEEVARVVADGVANPQDLAAEMRELFGA